MFVAREKMPREQTKKLINLISPLKPHHLSVHDDGRTCPKGLFVAIELLYLCKTVKPYKL